MKRATLLAAFVLLAAAATPALAVFRPSPVVIDGSSTLAAFMSAHDPTINVGLEQDNTQGFGAPLVGTASSSLMIEVTANAAGNAIGVYNQSDKTQRFQILPAAAQPGWFAVATFTAPSTMKVNIVDHNGLPVASTTYPGVEIDKFGYYIQNQGGVDDYGYTEDDKNAGNAVRALVYRSESTGGNWWVCFDDNTSDGGETSSDYDDAVLFIQALQPTPVTKSTWAAVKQRFR